MESLCLIVEVFFVVSDTAFNFINCGVNKPLCTWNEKLAEKQNMFKTLAFHC